MVDNIKPKEAIERLKTYGDDYDIKAGKFKINK